MTVITTPIDDTIQKMMNSLLEWEYTNKADIVRNAIRNYYEEKLLERIKLAEKDIKEGRIYEGDLDDLVKLVD
jgi:hypothetical protein